MKSTVMTGDYELLESNVVYMEPGDQEMILQLTLENDVPPILVRLLFEENEAANKHSINAEVTNDELIITCVNFNNPLGTGTTRAIPIAQIKETSIYFHFWAYKVGAGGSQTSRRVEYNFLKRK